MRPHFTRLVFKTLSVVMLCMVMLAGVLQSSAQVTVTATAGTLGPTVYTRLALAFNAINAGTHQGAITITITASTTETTVATLNRNAAPASYTSVSIKPGVGVTATINSAIGTNGPVYFYGASNVTLDGSNTVGGTTQNLTIANTSGTAGYVVRYGSPSAAAGCSNITVKNCIITGGGLQAGIAMTSGSGTTLYQPGEAANSNITIQNNTISGAQLGIYGYGPSASLDNNWLVTGNTISGCGDGGIQINNGQNFTISNNIITNIGNVAMAIAFAAPVTGITLSFNTAGGAIYANKIYSNTNLAAYGSYGIYLDIANVGAALNIYNNFIAEHQTRAAGAATATNATMGYGIYMDLGNNVNFYYNSINQSAASNPTGGGGAIGISNFADVCFDPYTPLGGITGGINFMNNIMVNTETNGNPMGFICLSPSSVFTTMNYNDYYVSLAPNYLGYASGVFCTTMAMIQTNFGSNLNSINFNPTWTSNTNLHLTTIAANAPLNAGFALPAITTVDIDGTTRVTPTIGAHELILCPPAITGTPTVICAGATTNYTDATAGGTWSSSAVGVATVSATGVVTGIAGGTANISYTIGTCSVTRVVTVNPITPILGTFSICQGNTTTLTDATGGGTWASSTTAVGTIGSSSGTVGGITGGTTTITYTTSAGCTATAVVTVYTTPTAILGTLSLCTGTTTSLTDAVAGGAWTSSNTVVGTVSATGVVNGLSAGTTNITYTMPGSCYITATVTVNASPTAILGTASVCVGLTTSLTDATGGGTWSSSNPGVGSVGTGSGTVTGVSGGTTTITYMMPGNCYVTRIVTVNPAPSAIGGTLTVCQGATTALTNSVAGGAWTSSNTAVGTISATGVVNGLSAGTTNITYTMPGNCYVTATVTVNASPTAILGTASVCVGLTTSLTDATGGGTWSSSNPGVGSVGTGSGTVTGVSGGTTTITYMMPGNCYVTTVVTVNPAPSAIGGTLTVCQGATTTLTNTVAGGAWTSSTTGVGTISATGVVTGIAGGTTTISYTSANCTVVTAVVTVNPVSPILGAPFAVCSGLSITLSDAIGGGTWSSSNTGVAIVGSSSGIVSGIFAGTATITDVFPTGCSASVVVTVNSSPVAPTGPAAICVGATATFSDGSAGGTWSSSNTGVGTIGTSSGIAGGISSGTTTITYTVAAGCTATTTLTVNPVPTAILGTLSICQGTTVTLTDATAGGTWGSIGVTIGGTTGTLTGVSIGTTIITYTLPTGCSALAVLTVNSSPTAIAGNHSVCLGSTTLLTDAPSGGTWASNNTAIGTIGSTSGVLGGIALGTAVITYTSPSGCTATTAITVNPLPSAISGTLNSCAGLFTSLSDATGGGTWSSSNTTVATIDPSSGLVDALATGTTTIDYTLTATGCYASAVFTVNSSPVAITGSPYLCEGTSISFGDGTPGGTWSSNSTNATIGSATGSVTGASAGVAIISYVLPTGCYTTYVLTITTAPTAVGGPNTVCVGYAVTLTDGVTSGAWSVTPGSGNASINSSGVLTGISTGVVVVSYSTFACNPAVMAVTVNPLPGPIVGVGNLCVGGSTSLTDATPGGAWSSSNATVTVSSTGVVSGVDTGAGTIIKYTLPTGCYVGVPVIVFPTPAPIQGTDSVCPGSTVVLSDATPGGIWSSSNGTIAHSVAITGEVDGVVTGTVHISYTLISGCYVTVPFRVLDPVPSSLSITQSPDTLLCAGAQPVTLTAVSVNGGTPTFEWHLFGGFVGSGPTYTFNTDTAHGNYYVCVMTTHNICASPAVVQDSIVMNVYPNVTPVVNISTISTRDTASYLGEAFTFLTEVTNGGVDPTYQWFINNVAVPGATNSTFTTRIYDTNDTVTCYVTGSSPCYTGSATGSSTGKVIYGLGFLSASSLSASSSEFSLFPNPNTGSFTLNGKLNGASNKDVALEVTDMLGRTVFTGSATPQNGNLHAEIKLDNDIAAGTYLLRVYTETGTETFHFVIGK